ncbi:unnamed protein product [Urochloa humidicola]
MGNAAAMPSAFPAAPLATPTIKLLIAKDAQVVVFAEAGKDAVDFLLGLLVMPPAAMFRLLGKDKQDRPMGALATLYDSVERMDPEYMQSPATRAALLNPGPAHPAVVAEARGYLSLVPPPAPAPQAHFPAPAPPSPYGPRRAPGLSSLKGRPLPLPPFNVHGQDCCPAAQAQESGGFVRGLVTYTVMDDLTLMPMSSISTIARLRRLGVEDDSALEERTVKIGYQEGLEILKASLVSKTVLTDVFLAKKKEKRARTTGDKNGGTSQQQEKKARNDPAAGKELATE